MCSELGTENVLRVDPTSNLVAPSTQIGYAFIAGLLSPAPKVSGTGRAKPILYEVLGHDPRSDLVAIL